MSGPSREAEELLAKLLELASQIEGYEATLAMLRFEQTRLRSALAATGYKPGQPDQGELL